jgi:hypothetical protein
MIPLIHRVWPLTFAAVCGAAFYPAQYLPRRPRAIFGLVLGAAIAIAPLLIPEHPRFFRLSGTLLAVTLSVKLYDLYWTAEAQTRVGIIAFAEYLFNPMALVLRRVLRERQPAFLAVLRQFMISAISGTAAIFLTIRVFQIHWRNYSFALEHCSKLVSFFLIIQFLPNAISALFRILGIPSTNFGGPFFLARTPAEFWRWYNRPAGQFFQEYIFKPAGGRRRLVVATLATFAFSGLVHEYVFDIPAGRILGTQMAFFLIQGLAAIATIRLKPRGWLRGPAIAATLAFNLLTGLMFFSSMNAVLPFYVDRAPQ